MSGATNDGQPGAPGADADLNSRSDSPDPLPGHHLIPTSEDHSGIEFIEIVQTVLTGIILAFVFRAFFVEGFVIPTGSMAETLYGRHGAMRCPDCAWAFTYGPANPARVDGPFLPPGETYCPNCRATLATPRTPSAERFGDRVLVQKWNYALDGLIGPRRWEVMVFRDPADVNQNYIKRVIGLPGEAVEIIDGDVYTQNPGGELRIARKSAAAQRVLWMPTYDQRFPPDPASSSSPWRPATRNSGWSGLSERRMTCIAQATDEVDWLLFDPSRPGYGTDHYSYNPRPGRVFVGDVRVRFELDPVDGVVLVRLTRDDLRFELQLDPAAQRATLRGGTLGTPPEWTLNAEWPAPRGRLVPVEFGHLDRELYVRLDGREHMRRDSGLPPPEALRGFIRTDPVAIAIGARGGRVTLGGVRIDRDVHYVQSLGAVRAFDRPFQLGERDYFVLGDNSPSSHDGREWTLVGKGTPEGVQPGVVPAELIVGRAFFVYLPSVMPLTESGRVWLPDLGRVRWVR